MGISSRTLNALLRDQAIAHQIGMLRLSRREYEILLELLEVAFNNISADVKGAISDLLGEEDILPSTVLNIQRLRGLSNSIKAAYDSLGRRFVSQMTDFAKYEAEFWTTRIIEGFPVAIDFTSVNPNTLRAIVRGPLHGRTIRQWFGDLGDASYKRMQDQITIGLLEGASNRTILNRIFGTQRNRFKDGTVAKDKQQLLAVVRTNLNAISAKTREILYDANGDLIKGVQWVSTLDTRTTQICRLRDGKVFPVGEGPRPPAHVQCRSTTTPVTKSWRELGIDLDEAPPGTRASLNGQAPEALTYELWLRQQPDAVQDEVLGVTRARLFREGNLSLSAFSDSDGNMFSLDTLRQREQGVWKEVIGGMSLNNALEVSREDVLSFGRSARREKALILDANGEVLLQKTGTRDAVGFSDLEVRRIKSRLRRGINEGPLYLVHNHPTPAAPLSGMRGDIGFMARLNPGGTIEAVTPDGASFVASNVAVGWGQGDLALMGRYGEKMVVTAIRNALQPLVDDGTLTPFKAGNIAGQLRTQIMSGLTTQDVSTTLFDYTVRAPPGSATAEMLAWLQGDAGQRVLAEIRETLADAVARDIISRGSVLAKDWLDDVFGGI